MTLMDPKCSVCGVWSDQLFRVGVDPSMTCVRHIPTSALPADRDEWAMYLHVIVNTGPRRLPFVLPEQVAA